MNFRPAKILMTSLLAGSSALPMGDVSADIMIETDAGTVVETADHGNRSAFNGTPFTTSMRIMYRRCLREFYERPTQTKRKRLQEIKQ